MPLIRPELAAALHRWREVLVSGGIALAGLWVARFGGWFFVPLGALIALTGAGLAVIGWRRLRFAQAVTDPGIVEVLEGQLAYMGPFQGGFVGLNDLAELALIRSGPARFWRLTPLTGPPLMVPVAALGSDGLFDAFARLPGLDSQALVDVLADGASGDRVLWRRAAQVTRAPFGQRRGP